MEDNKFFKIVWRFNSLIIMLASIAVLALVCYTFFDGYQRKINKTDIITNVADDPVGDEKWQLGYAERIKGTPHFLTPLISESENVKLSGLSLSASHSYVGSSYSSPSRNILFTNGENNEQKWLFPTNDQLLIDVELLTESEYSCESNTLAILYKIVKNDTNGDNKLSKDDLSSIFMSFNDGSRYEEIISEADRLNGVFVINAYSVLILYQRKGVGYSVTVQLHDFSISNTTELPKVGEIHLPTGQLDAERT